MNTESQAAWEAVKPHLSVMSLQILVAISELGAATDKEVTAYTSLDRLTVSERMCRMRQGGLLESTDEVRERSRARRLTEDGKRLLQSRITQ